MSDFAIDKPVIRFSRASDPWFFLHVHSKLGHQKPSKCFTCSLLSENQRYEAVTATTELIPIKDYLFRYDRGAFWMGAYGWDVIPLPFNQFGRRLLDSLFKTRTMYSIMHHSGQSQRFVVQDLAIPAEHAETFINYVAKDLHIWPLWLCPIKGGSSVPLHSAKSYTSRSEGSSMVMNIGVWGIPHTAAGTPIFYGRRTFPNFILLNRQIEAKVRELGGLKWLYAHNYAKEDEFWQTYDKAGYEDLRKKWKAEKLPTIWDKTGKEEHVWVPTSILRGFWRGLLGQDYLLRKK
jgi:delta24-sterol reductase